MKAGYLNQRLILQERKGSTEVVGGKWSKVRAFWGDVVPQVASSIKEGFPSDLQTTSSTYMVYARWRDGIRIDQRLLWADKILNITNVIPADARRREMILVCEEGLNRG